MMDEYVKINLGGFKQQVLILGDIAKPILLFCHGGPGTPTMSFLRKWNKPLLKHFLLVTWDQRGTGRSYSKDLNVNSISFDNIRQDGIELTDYLLNRFNKEKIFIMGHSFGATLALSMIKERPEVFYAYFAVSQFVNTTKNELACYQFLMESALIEGDTKVIAKLKKIGAPIEGYYKRPIKDMIIIKQLVSKYNGDMKNKSSTLSVLIEIIFSKEYGYLNAPKTIKGMQISLEKVGMSLKGISYDETHRILDIPVYFFSGDYDQLTPQNILRDYYKVIQAPHKEIFYFHESAHSPLWEESDKFHHILEEVFLRDFSNDK